MKERLIIYNFIDGNNDQPFYNVKEPLELNEYSYTSQRMGGVTLSATLMYQDCLDNFWDGTQYVLFNKEKYFLKNIPSSSKSNEDARYKHELEFISERELKLNNIYFYDAVSSSDDKYKSNSTNVFFYGDINEFASRLQASLSYSGLSDYSVIIDSGISSEAKEINFSDLTFFEALQESYNVYEIPFYFNNKEIHFGFTSNAITHTFKYGVDNELLSINKNNANYKVVTRCAGTGSEENIPYYYPNNSPKGNIKVVTGNFNSGVLQENIRIINYELFSEKISLGKNIVCKDFNVSNSKIQIYAPIGNDGDWGWIDYNEYTTPMYDYGSLRSIGGHNYRIVFTASNKGTIRLQLNWIMDNFRTYNSQSEISNIKVQSWVSDVSLSNTILNTEIQEYSLSGSYEEGLKQGDIIEFEIPEKGSYVINVIGKSRTIEMPEEIQYEEWQCNLKITSSLQWKKTWIYDDNIINLADIGIAIDSDPMLNDYFYQEKENYIAPVSTLMPPIYRESIGTERFYNAVNNTYTNPETGDKYTFENEYNPLNPKEHIVTFEEIKPTIKNVTNAGGQEIGQFLDIAYDEDDNDDMDSEGKYLHPYFFVKLPKFDGQWGFNLFDQAIENGEMTLSMTDGNCGACKFSIAVDENSLKNTVQVDENGDLLKDENGNVKFAAPQNRQNDTQNYEVWIALKKDIDTFGVIMPNAANNYKPNIGDKFVILNILLPNAYIYKAEEDLKNAIIKYMIDNNSEKFNFSINFSRIFLGQNTDIFNQLNENARIQLEYNNNLQEFYISQYSYKAVENEPLPEITVELSDTITINRSALQNTIDSIQTDIMNSVGSIDFLKQGLRYFIRKDVEDVANKTITFKEGAVFGNYSAGSLGSGGSIYLDQYGNSNAEFDFLTIRRKAIFNELSVKELKHIGGELILSPAAMVCNKTEIYQDFIRCYFENQDKNGNVIYNEFQVGDQARSQSFNNLTSSYFWRLVVGIGENYIDLSLSDADNNSGLPQTGDNIVQLGNRTNKLRQSAIILSTTAANSPSSIVYNEINSFSLENKAISGNIFDTENNEPHFFNYGSMFLGDNNINDPDASYIAFKKEQDDLKKQMYVNANIIVGKKSSGLTNFENYENLIGYLNNIFPNQPSVISNGAVLAKLLGVQSQDGEVISMLNGSDIGIDKDHGKLLIAAGMPSIEQAYNAKTRIYEDGHIETNDITATGGEFDDIVIKGSSRSPFYKPIDSFDQHNYSDNIVLLGQGGGWTTAYDIPSGISQSGRKLTFINYKWGDSVTGGRVTMYGSFFENQTLNDSIYINPNECIELLGYADKTTWYGWIVLNRFKFIKEEGEEEQKTFGAKTFAMGKVVSTQSSASITYKTFDNSSLTVNRLTQGRYKINIPTNWITDINLINVQVTGIGETLREGVEDAAMPVNATIQEIQSSYITIVTHKEGSLRDGSFNFIISQMEEIN